MEQKAKIAAGLLCPYCLKETQCMEAGEAGAPRLLPGRRAMVCPDCGSFVYCHPLTSVPLGSVADKELRRLRWETHQVFEMLPRLKLKRSRYNAYSWLSLQLGLSKDVTHIGLFDEATCRRAIDICTRYIRRNRPDAPLPPFCNRIICPDSQRKTQQK